MELVEIGSETKCPPKKGIVQLHICDFFFFFFVFRNLIALFSPLSLQKMKEYLEGRNLITKLQAKHDLLQKTLGESECGSSAGGLTVTERLSPGLYG